MTTQEFAFLEYLERHKKLIVKVARAYCREAEDRKDLVQDIVLQLWKAFPKFDQRAALSTFTYRIAINVSISSLRKTLTRDKTRRAYNVEAGLLQVNDTAVEENLERLYSFIDLLRPLDKAVMILCLDGCSNKEIADVMGMSPTNISTKKHRILEKLKESFKTQQTRHEL